MGCTSNKSGVAETTLIPKLRKEEQLKYGIGSDGLDKIQFQNFIDENQRKYKDFYRIGRTLGEGTYGIVQMVEHRQTKEVRAMKKIPKKSLTKEEQKQKLVNDILILRGLDHPNIVKIYEFYQDQHYFYVVSEYCSGGEVLQRLQQLHQFSEREAANIIKQVLEVVYYSHRQQIAHRDLKPDNIMIDQAIKINENKEDYLIKVIDWGCSSFFQKGQFMNAFVGTPYYLAPEVIEQKYTEKADLWSIGGILYTLLCGEPLFIGESLDEVLNLIKDSKNWDFPDYDIWKQVSPDAKDLIKKLMTYDPQKRLSAKQALQHSWIKNAPPNIITQDLKKDCSNKMKTFRAKNIISNAVITFITKQLVDKKDKQELISAFKAIDKDNNGTLSRAEIENYFKENMTNDEIQELMANVDLNENGQVNYAEFINAALDKNKIITKEKLKIAFDYFDKDQNGFITSDEMNRYLQDDMKQKNEELWLELIQKADINHDGKINFDEFLIFMELMVPEN